MQLGHLDGKTRFIDMVANIQHRFTNTNKFPHMVLVITGTLLNSFHLSGNSSLFQTELMFMDLRANCSTPCFNQFCWDFIHTW